MDEVRCPMCSKKNPADAESCEFCGARIKPLIIRQPPENAPSIEERIVPSRMEQPEEKPQEPEPAEKQLPQETDWLSRMRLGVEDKDEDEFELSEDEVGPKRGETDLLGRFRDLGISDDKVEQSLDGVSIEEESEVPKEFELETAPDAKPSLDLDRILPESEAEKDIEPFLPDERLLQDLTLDLEAEGEQEEPHVPDWLARIRAREVAEEEKEAEKPKPPEPPKRTGDTDWLSGLRDVSFTDEEEELPDSLDELLNSDVSPELKKTLEPLISDAPTKEEPPSGDVDEEISEAQASIEDLFSELDLFEEEDEISVGEPALEFGSPPPVEDDLSDLEDLFEDLELPEHEEGQGLFDDDFFAQPETPSAKEVDKLFSEGFFADVEDKAGEELETAEEDLFGDMEEGLVEKDEPLLDADFFADLGIEIAESDREVRRDEPVSDIAKPPEVVPTREMDFEEDLQSEPFGIPDLAPGSDLLARDSFIDELDKEEVTSPLERTLEEIPSERSPLSDLLGDFSPSWMDDTISEGGGDLPHVPALILDDEMPPLDSSAGEGDLASMEIPDWLQDLGRDVEEELIDQEDDIPILVKATLPPWLEAMRPIETFRATHEIELELEEEEEIIEAAGPLAGLKGVLLAEPVVAMPRTSITAISALDITDRDLNQADILQRMVEEEEREEGEYAAKRVQVPVLRWVCAALLVLAVIIPSVLGGPTFGSPTRAPRDLSPFLDLIRTIPVEKPVLLVFDYEPSYSAEMDAVAGALVENLFARSQAVVTLSTKPSGPMLADRMLRRVGKIHQAANGEDYLHLGYLSGGPAAVQLLVGSSLEASVQGFNLPEEFEGNDVWDSPILTGIDQLSDFAMVAVITSAADGARIWAEQVSPQLGSIPMVMVLSAGAEPIIRPYFEAEDHQVDGILSGLPSAMIYEERVIGFQADAAQRWDGYGMGLLVAVMILLSGTGYSITSWIVERLQMRHS
jgi:hypothetical protein